MNRPTTGRAAIVTPALAIALLAAVITWTSFDVDDPQAYLFPRLVAAAMLALAALNVWQALRTASEPVVAPGAFARSLPGLGVLFAYVLWAAEAIGFYSAGLLCLLLVQTLYDPGRRTPRRLAQQLASAGSCIIVLYLLFTVLLQVQLPRGVLF